jgi:serine/threonine protein kinase
MAGGTPNPEKWERIGSLFQRALALPPDERAEFLREQCGDDESVRAEVVSLVEAHAAAEGFLDHPVLHAPSSTPRLASGTRLGVFEILERLGAGGMGEVYRARDTRLDRLVAIKVLSGDLASDPRGRERFEREAHIISKLTHPHICTLHDLGSASVQGVEVPFLVMELLEGETLATRLARAPLPVAQALRCAIEIAEALAAAHALGIVHRDLKPANIMLTKAGVELLDFGLARLREPIADRGPMAAAGRDGLTSAGMILGTLPYMAPEQVRGEDVDARTDLFAFGAVLYEMLTGARAFAAESQAGLIAAILEHDPLPLSTRQPLTPPALEHIVDTCLAKNPRERWQHAQDLVFALREIGERGAAEHVQRPAATTRSRGGIGRWLPHAAWALLVATLALMLWLDRPVRNDAVPRPNPQPIIVLMDSPGRVYDKATQAAGATNADDVSDALRDLPVVMFKENTSSMWHREDQVIRENPDLIISHLSCLLDERMANADEALEEHLFALAANRLTLFFGYLGAINPRTRFLVYSRRHFADNGAGDAWVGDVVARFPKLKGRVFTMSMPGGRASATFRDPATAAMLRTQVKAFLGLR